MKLCHINRSGPIFLRHTVVVDFRLPWRDYEAIASSNWDLI